MASPRRAIAGDDLALVLERSSDQLARLARDSLGSPDAPESLPIWTSSRSDLLATYEVRLARAETGEGPTTQRLREYTEMLREARTPASLDEIGWEVGDTFYVALLHGDEVLALTTVARAVWYLEDRITHRDSRTDQWIDIKTFGIGDGFNDLTLIKNMLDQPAYADDYQGSPRGEQPGGVHGPYRLDAVDAAAFIPVAADEAHSLLGAWADQTSLHSDVTPAVLASSVYAIIEAADRIYRFPMLSQDSLHEKGWVVGISGFHEFIAIDRTEHRLSVIVASDD